MTAKDLLDAGCLGAAVEQLNQEVRAHPTDIQRRTFLFELLCFSGDLQRAERQLDVIAQQSTSAEVGVQVYRNILTAERARQRLFTDGLQPDFLFDPPPYLAWHLAALNRLREGNGSEAVALLNQAEQARGAVKGRITGQPFSDFRDGDDVLAPVLEVVIHRNYVWLPFEQIKALHIASPKRLRDLIWIPATIEGHQGPVGEVFLPVLYVASSSHPNDQVKLGRMTDWRANPEEPMQGVGQHLFYIDGQDRGILEVRDIEFDASDTPSPMS